jgi:tetratricopeptide (TPR) repeat protein
MHKQLDINLYGTGSNELARTYMKDAERAYSGRKDELALKLYSVVINIAPDNVEALYKKGLILKNTKKDFRASIEMFTKVIRLNPRYKGAYFIRAGAYARLEEAKAYLSDLTTLIEQGDPQTYYFRYRAREYMRQGRYEEAIKDYESSMKASDVSPDCIIHAKKEIRYCLDKIEGVDTLFSR